MPKQYILVAGHDMTQGRIFEKKFFLNLKKQIIATKTLKKQSPAEVRRVKAAIDSQFELINLKHIESSPETVRAQLSDIRESGGVLLGAYIEANVGTSAGLPEVDVFKDILSLEPKVVGCFSANQETLDNLEVGLTISDGTKFIKNKKGDNISAEKFVDATISSIPELKTELAEVFSATEVKAIKEPPERKPVLLAMPAEDVGAPSRPGSVTEELKSLEGILSKPFDDNMTVTTASTELSDSRADSRAMSVSPPPLTFSMDPKLTTDSVASRIKPPIDPTEKKDDRRDKPSA